MFFFSNLKNVRFIELLQLKFKLLAKTMFLIRGSPSQCYLKTHISQSIIVVLPYFYAPNFEKVGDILVSACPYVYVCVCVCVCVCIHVRDIVLKLHVWIPHGKIADSYFWFFPELSPLVKLRPFDKQGDEIL